MDWYEIDLKSLNKMIEINKSGKEVSALEDFSTPKEDKKLISEDSITRFDKKIKRKYAI